MDPARVGLVRNALGSLAVTAIVAFTTFGLPFLDHQLPAGRPVAAGVPYAVGGGVTIVAPVRSWVDVTRTRPGTDRGTVLFVVDGVRLAVVTGPFHGTVAEAAQRLRAKITKSAGYQVTGPAHPIVSDQGVAGLLGPYSSAGRLGEYAVYVARDHAVEVTLSGSEDQLRKTRSSLMASLASVAFVGGG